MLSEKLLLFALASVLSAYDAPDVFAFVKKNCVACHNATVTNGDVNLAAFETAQSFDESRETWERVVGKIKTGEMPPPAMKKPPGAPSREFHPALEE